MLRSEHDYGRVLQINAEAVGVPGKRRFRIIVEAEGGKVCAWLDKQELSQLALGVQELLASSGPREQASSTRSGPAAEVGSANLDFQVARLALGYDRRSDLFVLEMSDDEAGRRGRPMLRLAVERSRMSAFAEEALAVCAAGRPLCPLCESPMGPDAHVCPRSNGHVKV